MKLRYYKYSAARGVEKIKTRTAMLLMALGMLFGSGGGLMLLSTSIAHADASTVIVAPSNTQGWFAEDQRPGGNYAYIADATSPLPTGALQLTTDNTTASKIQYMHPANVNLADVSAMSYNTKHVSGPNEADPSYQLEVDLNGTSASYTTLVYEPYWNGTVNDTGTWQNWDVMANSAQLWSSKSFTDGSCSVTAGAGGAPFYSLASLKAACPNAVVLNFGVDVGTYNLNYNVETDGVNFNGTTYDFEQVIPDHTKPTVSFTNPTSFSQIFAHGPNTSIAFADTGSGVKVAVIHAYKASDNSAAKFCTASSSDLTNGTMSCDLSGLADGTYVVKAGATDNAGNNQTISSGNFVIDSVAPVVAITHPANGSTVYGTVDVRGTVTDAHPDHYYTVVKDKNGHVVAGPGTVADSSSFTNQHLFNWNTKAVADGVYTIDLEARDAAGNKDAGSVATVKVTVNNTPDTKNECKDGGWRNFTKPAFRNQGQCVSYVQHHQPNHRDSDRDDHHSRWFFSSWFSHKD